MKKKRERDREIDRETDRQTERQTERQGDRDRQIAVRICEQKVSGKQILFLNEK